MCVHTRVRLPHPNWALSLEVTPLVISGPGSDKLQDLWLQNLLETVVITHMSFKPRGNTTYQYSDAASAPAAADDDHVSGYAILEALTRCTFCF